MKDRLVECKLAVPTYAPVDCAMDVITFVQKHGYPVGQRTPTQSPLGLKRMCSCEAAQRPFVHWRHRLALSRGALSAHTSARRICAFSQKLVDFLNSASFSAGGVDAVLDLEVESFVQGQMYHIDGLVLNGDLKICW
jgi:hypothetical protein